MMIAVNRIAMLSSDKELLNSCRSGDIRALEKIYVLYERQVFRYAYHLLGNRDEADDMKQETFVKAYQAIAKFRGDSSLQTWLLKICGNLCRDRMKSWDRRKVQYDSRFDYDGFGSDPHQNDPQMILEKAQVNETVMKALKGMPAAQREIIVLHEIEDLSHEEISVILSCTRTSVKLRLFRARKSLRERVHSLLDMNLGKEEVTTR